MNRRDFLVASTATIAGLARRGLATTPPLPKPFPKALIGEPNLDTLRQWKAAGFDGMETTAWKVSPQEAAVARKMAESVGMTIHSVMFGWGKLNQGEAALSEGVAKMERALRAAQGYGADAVLYVPCRIDGMKMPDPWEFDIHFDAATGHLQQVAAGNNAPYAKYIAAHNQAVDAAKQGIRRMIPTAKATGVIIAVENVWNNLWVKPDVFANFVASFDSPWVRAYFDIGNHVKYAPSENWIRTLGKLIVKCHVKDFKLAPDGRGGNFCDIRDGSVNWPAVRKALDAVGYRGWMTIEGVGLPLDEESRRLDRIIAGE